MIESVVRIKFDIHKVGIAYGELRRILAPMTFSNIVSKLPVSGPAGVWKKSEVYIPIDINKGLEKGTKDIDIGVIAYWPIGDALCVFYKKVEPYSPVNKVGYITAGLDLFEQVRVGTRITIEKA